MAAAANLRGADERARRSRDSRPLQGNSLGEPIDVGQGDSTGPGPPGLRPPRDTHVHMVDPRGESGFEQIAKFFNSQDGDMVVLDPTPK